ncbi:MAG: hypothetical protein LC102_05105 [Ignavibacteriales bacterium]|nr:hypothetical protein [Ignavibacteria bacterium]MBZ0196277.1 hypothetical protein [Ignavibacteriaceae bacterium]MCZ2142786.1 hypothetical protein [Ignavibacteriales bacterium]
MAFIIGAIIIGLFFVKSAAGLVKFVIKIAIYALIGYAVYKGLIYIGLLK